MQLQNFKLSVLMPLAAGGHCVHVYTVQHSAGLDWMRQHADELATRLNGRGYDALYVEAPAPRFDLSDPAQLRLAFAIHRDGGPRALWRAMNPAESIPTTAQVEDCAAAFYTAFNARNPGTF